MTSRWNRLRRDFLGINRRNHELLFGHNPRARYRVADDKRATKALLTAHGLPTPLLHAECAAHWEIARIGRLLAGLPSFVLKPARGAGGAGIVVVTGRAGEGFRTASGAVWRWDDLATHIVDVLTGVYAATGFADALLVEALVVTDRRVAHLAYCGVPDLRILAFRGVPILAMLRLPTRRSQGRANLHLGGLGVGVDLSSGRTTTAVQRGHPVARHPDLGVALRDTQLPDWPATLLLAARAAEVSGLGFVGIDIVFDASHGPQVLELNARPGLAIQAANQRGVRPLLSAVAREAVPDDLAARVHLGQTVAATARTDS